MMPKSNTKTKSWSDRVKKSSSLINEALSLVSETPVQTIVSEPLQATSAQTSFWSDVLTTTATPVVTSDVASTDVPAPVATSSVASSKKPYKQHDGKSKKPFNKDNKESPYFIALTTAQTQFLNELVSDVTILKLEKMDNDCMHINNYRKKHWVKEGDDEIVVTSGDKQFTFSRAQFFANVNFHYRFRELISTHAPNLWVWLNIVDEQMCLIFNKSR